MKVVPLPLPTPLVICMIIAIVLMAACMAFNASSHSFQLIVVNWATGTTWDRVHGLNEHDCYGLMAILRGNHQFYAECRL